MKKDNIIINRKLEIPYGDLIFRFARSGGKGGQNVNKVETKVELLFDPSGSAALSDHERDLIREALRQWSDSEGVIRIISQASRSQWENRLTAVEKFKDLIQKALRPRKKRVKTKISSAGRENRLTSKKKRGDLKKTRRVRHFDD